MDYNALQDKKILIVEDDNSMSLFIRKNLEDKRCIVQTVGDVQSAENAMNNAEHDFDIAIIDMYIPETPDTTQEVDRVMRGEELAYAFRKRSPNTKIIGISINLEREPFTPLCDLFSGFIYKKDMPYDEKPLILFETIEGILLNPAKKTANIFIVHGHDNEYLFELKDYIQNTLNFGEPTILRERASSGKTIIEKFEKEVRNIDIVFVLLTPDDKTESTSNKEVRRARQNVIFELGFFYGKLQRTKGKILLLSKGDIEIPSDISGIGYIDVTNGIKSASEEIRAELRNAGWL